MGLFNFFKNKGDASTASTQNFGQDTLNEIPEEVFTERADPIAFNTMHEVTPQNIIITNNLDQLYVFLDRNLESKGYDDALINPDSFHLEQNLEAHKKELMRNIKRVKTFYEDFIREINYHIESRSRSGMIDTVEELKMKKEIAESHIEKVLLIETETESDRGDSQGVIISYKKGFRNGLAAISHHAIISKKF